MNPNDVKHSKFLSKVLRHDPGMIGVQLDLNGWIDVDELLAAFQRHGTKLDRQTLERVVATNNKQRFSFSEDGKRIRANQGHSVEIELDLEPIEPLARLYHGTAEHSLPAIRQQGLVKGKRHHVHLSADTATAHAVGKRHGNPVILCVLAHEMHQDGYIFFRSANGVWLTESVPVKYLREA